MTREEAIQILKDISWQMASVKRDENIQAIDMAIKALQFAEHFDLLKEFQSLQEVVRCKDCIWRNEHCGMGEHKWCEKMNLSTAPNDFCSYGERREECD